MNQWPVVFLSLKDIDGLNFEDAYERLVVQISNLYKNYTYLLEYDKIDPDDRQIFLDLKAGKAEKGTGFSGTSHADANVADLSSEEGDFAVG